MSFRMDWLDLLAVQGTLKSLLQHQSSNASIFQCSAFFIVQLSHPYMTTEKTIALTLICLLFLAVLGLPCSPRLSLVLVSGDFSLWHHGGFPCCNPMALEHRLSSCGTHGMWNLLGSGRDRTRVPCIGRRFLNHWTTREVLAPLCTCVLWVGVHTPFRVSG